jgi:hypothetical protein
MILCLNSVRAWYLFIILLLLSSLVTFINSCLRELSSVNNEQDGGNNFMRPEKNTADDDTRPYITVILRILPKVS